MKGLVNFARPFLVTRDGFLMKINNINGNINFRGPLDGVITSALRTCDMNEMVNAVGLDIGAMVIPRAYYDTKKRNQFAGAETFFREISGTFINCLAAGIFAKLIAKLLANRDEVKINPNSWFTKNSMETLSAAWNGNTKNYVENVFDNLSGRDGHNINKFNDIKWQKVEWIDELRWKNIKWNDKKYEKIENKLTSKEGFVETMTEIINDKNIIESDKQHVLTIMERRLTNALGAERNAEVNIKGHKFSSKLENILRDVHDMGKDVFGVDGGKSANKILKRMAEVNKTKAIGAIVTASVLGLTNQYINRKITEKRTGMKGFVGDVDFTSTFKGEKKKDNFLLLKKLGASALMAGMVFSTMGVKNLKQFARKLEFSGAITSGNAIKTVYGFNIIGRFMAADNGTELRESMTRDYLGFLNWLVFGGFAAKGVANLLDKKGENLFNYTKKGSGLKHWLNDMSLKTHNEVAAKGKEFAKKNMWKLNLAQASGIAYSAITLGILLPMLNAKITEHKSHKKEQRV